MMKRVFDELGYRRYEWKCDNLNPASQAEAQRLGFKFEGIFRPGAGLQGSQPGYRVVEALRRCGLLVGAAT
jgi:RimJ/RimL family protein N-acetyltransferase